MDARQVMEPTLLPRLFLGLPARGYGTNLDSQVSLLPIMPESGRAGKLVRRLVPDLRCRSPVLAELSLVLRLLTMPPVCAIHLPLAYPLHSRDQDSTACTVSHRCDS